LGKLNRIKENGMNVYGDKLNNLRRLYNE